MIHHLIYRLTHQCKNINEREKILAYKIEFHKIYFFEIISFKKLIIRLPDKIKL